MPAAHPVWAILPPRPVRSGLKWKDHPRHRLAYARGCGWESHTRSNEPWCSRCQQVPFSIFGFFMIVEPVFLEQWDDLGLYDAFIPTVVEVGQVVPLGRE